MGLRFQLVLALSTLMIISTAFAGSSKAADTPDFSQTDSEAGFETSGEQFCAPTSVSNSLMWFAAHGYQELLPAAENKHDAQAEIIRQLGGGEFMNTSPAIGTDVRQIISGARKYVQQAGYQVSEIRYEGWRPAGDAVTAEIPDLDDIKATIDDDKGAVWLNVGWYRFDEEASEYERRGGHWVTVVGYDGDDLLIHDPSPATGDEFWTQRVSLTALTGGQLTGQQANLPRDAAGYYEVTGEMKKGSSTCILDGAVLMTLE